MSKFTLDIDGFIGDWGYSRSVVKNFLAAAGKNPVEVRVSSLGGSIDHALGIHDQFVAHGDVTIILSAFNASSATLITLGAKKVEMYSNSFYLIHKALQWVDTWGNMNEDDIDQLIVTLEKEKNELQKVTLVLAKMYAKKSGRPTSEILELMKQETWLNAEEALAWGFVDEITEPVHLDNPLQNKKLISMLNYSDLPVPEARTAKTEVTASAAVIDTPISQVATNPDATGVGSLLTSVTKTIRTSLTNFFTMTKLTALNSVLGVPSLESTEEGTYLNTEQLGAINLQLDGIQSANTERDQAVNDRTQVMNSLSEIDPTIAQAATIEGKIEAIRTMLASKPAVAPSGVKTTSDKTPSPDGVDWDLLNSLPHMQEDQY